MSHTVLCIWKLRSNCWIRCVLEVDSTVCIRRGKMVQQIALKLRLWDFINRCHLGVIQQRVRRVTWPEKPLGTRSKARVQSSAFSPWLNNAWFTTRGGQRTPLECISNLVEVTSAHLLKMLFNQKFFSNLISKEGFWINIDPHWLSFSRECRLDQFTLLPCHTLF